MPAFLHRLVHCAAALVACLLALGAGAAPPVHIRILQTADIHATLDGRPDTPAASWLRLGTLIRQHRTEQTLLIDCGDTCQGSLVGTLSKGEVGVQLLAALDYDVWVPGNHELDFGIGRARDLVEMARQRVLCGNVIFRLEDQPQRYQAWRMFERGGARIAVIGGTASYMRHWVWGEGKQMFEVGLVADLLERTLPDVLRARPDMIVLATHQGWLKFDPREVNEVGVIADRFPEIDLILGAHTHRALPGERIGKRTWYVQPPPYAMQLAVVDAVVDTDAHKVVRITSKLVPVTESIPKDPELVDAASSWLELAQETAARVVGEAAEDIPGRGTPGTTCATSELLCRALSEAAQAEVVFHGKLSQYGLAQGRVSERDLFDIVPYENSIVVGYLTADQIRRVVSEQYANRNSYVYCGPWGVYAAVQPDGQTELRELPDALAGQPEARARVAFNSYTAAGGGGRFPILAEMLRLPECRAEDLDVNTRDALRNYLGKHNPLTVTPTRWLLKGGQKQ